MQILSSSYDFLIAFKLQIYMWFLHWVTLASPSRVSRLVIMMIIMIIDCLGPPRPGHLTGSEVSTWTVTKDKSLRTPLHPHMHSWILNHDNVRAEVSRKYPPSGTVRIAIRSSVGIIRRPPQFTTEHWCREASRLPMWELELTPSTSSHLRFGVACSHRPHFWSRSGYPLTAQCWEYEGKTR